ncbi:hypothetical protein SDC9_73254 [bioreactor metagenome]|uniref:Uncharacterized protein n=1 Tax=bioreactor metagenome TaxID=1076179 RepID=A0A644YEK7_9ZZZZ
MKTNRISKNVKALILSGLIIGSTSLANIANADTIEKNVNSNNPINIMTEGNEEIEIKEITRDQYVENLAKDQGITIQEADKIAEDRTEKALEKINKEMPQMKNVKSARSNIVWRQASWTQTYPKNKSFKAELIASFEVWTGGSFRQINSCTVGSSLAAGQHKASWNQLTDWKTTSYPVTRATVGVTGKFMTTVTTGGNVGMSLPGFSVSGSGSTTKTFVSNSMTMQREWSVY